MKTIDKVKLEINTIEGYILIKDKNPWSLKVNIIIRLESGYPPVGKSGKWTLIVSSPQDKLCRYYLSSKDEAISIANKYLLEKYSIEFDI